jgi:hypothetical protein
MKHTRVRSERNDTNTAQPATTQADAEHNAADCSPRQLAQHVQVTQLRQALEAAGQRGPIETPPRQSTVELSTTPRMAAQRQQIAKAFGGSASSNAPAQLESDSEEDSEDSQSDTGKKKIGAGKDSKSLGRGRGARGGRGRGGARGGRGSTRGRGRGRGSAVQEGDWHSVDYHHGKIAVRADKTSSGTWLRIGERNEKSKDLAKKSEKFEEGSAFYAGFHADSDYSDKDDDDYQDGLTARGVGILAHAPDQPQTSQANYVIASNVNTKEDFADAFGGGQYGGVGAFTGQNFSGSGTVTKSQQQYQDNFNTTNNLHRNGQIRLHDTSSNPSKFIKIEQILRFGGPDLYSVESEGETLKHQQGRDRLFDSYVRSRRKIESVGKGYFSDEDDDSEVEKERLSRLPAKTHRRELARLKKEKRRLTRKIRHIEAALGDDGKGKERDSADDSSGEGESEPDSERSSDSGSGDERDASPKRKSKGLLTVRFHPLEDEQKQRFEDSEGPAISRVTDVYEKSKTRSKTPARKVVSDDGSASSTNRRKRKRSASPPSNDPAKKQKTSTRGRGGGGRGADRSTRGGRGRGSRPRGK